LKPTRSGLSDAAGSRVYRLFQVGAFPVSEGGRLLEIPNCSAYSNDGLVWDEENAKPAIKTSKQISRHKLKDSQFVAYFLRFLPLSLLVAFISGLIV
jgi:hypothetical protein